MSLKNTLNGYGSVARFFHWVIFLLVLILIVVGFIMVGIEDKALKAQIVNVHKLTGLLVLTLMILRGLWALMNVKPLLPFGTPDWEKVAERGMHYLLYLGLIIMPLSGWLGSTWAGRFPHLGDISFKLPLVPNEDLAGFAFENVHIPLAFILIALVSLHACAALYHHFIKKDNVLRRMLLGREDF